MKIVSKTKDYYDHVANILGVDEKLRYERRPFREEKLYDGSPFFPEFAEFTIPRPVEDDYQAAYPKTPFFRQINRTLGEIFAAGYQNDTDSQTDYFDKGRVNIYEGHPLYEKAMERVKMNDAAFEVRQEKKKAARAERANARFYR